MRTDDHDSVPPELRTIAVVLGGGSGTRVGLAIPKQLIKIAGKTVLEHTLATLEASSDIDEIIVMMTPGYVKNVRTLIDAAGYRKVSTVLPGGDTRSDTTRIALAAIEDAECNVLFHDAVRPLVGFRIIRECVNALRTHDAVDVATPSPDTIIAVDGDDCITGIPPRATLRLGQTPQGFRLSVIRRAYERATADPDFVTTDDCGVVHHYLPDVPIKVVEGAAANMKVTVPLDVFIVDKLFQLASQTVPGSRDTEQYADELRGRTMVVFGGGTGIGADLVTLGRSLGADVFSYSRGQTGTHAEDPVEVDAALRQAYEETGRIDYVVVTAGMLHIGPLADATPALIDEALRANYLAPVTVARAAVGYLTKTRGQLLLYTSSSYTRGRANYALYSSCKAAVVNLMQALADEWSDLGVRVNCINPERTATPMRTRAFGDEPPETLLSSTVVARSSLDVLISDLTGHVFDVRRGSRDPLTAA
ncbi:MAG TPA: bifunctional cytidylyltransferase/SDR family oxidoreductase [Micromonosporaceae bacterium]